MLITYPKIEKLSRRLDASCGLIQAAHAASLITAEVNQELHKQALCYAGLLQDVEQGSADTDNANIQDMFECVDQFCTLIEDELKPRVAA